MLKTLRILFIFLFVSNLTFGQNALEVTPINPVDNTIEDLVGSLLGSGVIVENIRCNLKETSRALGKFQAPPNLIGITGGVMMVTGIADTVDGPNTTGIMSNQIPYADTVDGASIGRQMLNAVLDYTNTGTSSRTATDCATIQFDIIPATDSIKFNYVFASEEYNTFVCSNFNDIFGFFIKGPGITGDLSLAPTFPETKNIALIPGTDLPVAINTVNNGEPGSGTGDNCDFTPQGIAAYVDNTVAANFPFIHQNLKFNGLTKVLTAGVKVIPCNVYTLTLTISDVNDRSYDSGVFIEKGSLRSSGVTAVQSSVFNSRFPYAIVDCNPGKFIFERCSTNTIEPLTAQYKLSGTAVNDVDYKRQLPDGTLTPFPESYTLDAGEWKDSLTLVGVDNPSWEQTPSKTVVIKFLNRTLPYFPNGQPNYRGDSTTLTIKRRYSYTASPDIKLCQGEDSLLKPVTTFDSRDRYRWVELAANGDTTTTTSLSCTDCATPSTSALQTTTYLLYLTDSLSGCRTTDTVKVEVFTVPTLQMTTDKPGNSVCKGDAIRLFANPASADPAWTYQWKAPLPANSIGVLADTLKKINFGIVSHNVNQYYVVKATNPIGCTKTDSIEVRILTRPIFKLPELDTICFGETIRIEPIELADTLKTEFSWRAVPQQRGLDLSDSLNPYITVSPKASGRFILEGRNNCVVGGIAKDTFNLMVIDSISAGHTYTYQGDSMTVAPVQFEGTFYPPSFPRVWSLRNADLSWDTLLNGSNPLVSFRKGGDYTSQVIVYTQQGSHYCSDTVQNRVLIKPLGSVFVPTLVTDNEDNRNSTFLITARDENGNILREIKEGKLVVFNRWGVEVYKNDSYNNELNSSKLKEELTDGIYFFEYSVARYNYKTGGWFRIHR